MYIPWSLPYPNFDSILKPDNSASMEFLGGGRRKETLRRVLRFLAQLHGALSYGRRGIKAIRFFNSTVEFRADNVQEKADINDLIESTKFEGLTCIGARLMRAILKPFVFEDDPSWVKGTPRKLRQMERPLLIMVITDGAVTLLLPPLSTDLRTRVLSCMHECAG